MARLNLYLASDNVLEIGKGGTPLQKRISGAAITSGTVTATIWNASVNPMVQVGGTLTLSHQGTPDGYWSATIDDDWGTSGLTEGMSVVVKLTVNAGAGFQLYAEIDGIVEVYKGEE